MSGNERAFKSSRMNARYFNTIGKMFNTIPRDADGLKSLENVRNATSDFCVSIDMEHLVVGGNGSWLCGTGLHIPQKVKPAMVTRGVHK